MVRNLCHWLLAILLFPAAAQAQSSLVDRLPDLPASEDAPTCPTPAAVKRIDLIMEAIAADANGAGVLMQLVDSPRHEAIRKSAVTWLARTGSDAAVPFIRARIDRNPERLFKQHLVLELSRITGALSLASVIDLVRGHSDPFVRYIALVGLSIRAEPHAQAEFLRIAHDVTSPMHRDARRLRQKPAK